MQKFMFLVCVCSVCMMTIDSAIPFCLAVIMRPNGNVSYPLCVFMRIFEFDYCIKTESHEDENIFFEYQKDLK